MDGGREDESLGRCAEHEAPGAIRLRLEDRPTIHADLCDACFRVYAIMRAEEETSLRLLHLVAKALGVGVWRDGPNAYLLRPAFAESAAG